MKPRNELIREYVQMYYERTNRTSFAKNYNRMIDMWIDFTPEERTIINKRLSSDMMLPFTDNLK